MSEGLPDAVCQRLDVIPEAVWQRIEEFSTLAKTGQITLNFVYGQIKNGDVREHFVVMDQKVVDKSMPSTIR